MCLIVPAGIYPGVMLKVMGILYANKYNGDGFLLQNVTQKSPEGNSHMTPTYLVSPR